MIRRAVTVAGYVAVSVFVLRCFMRATSLADDLPYVLTFSTPRPYVYRVLTPLVLRALVAVLPSSDPLRVSEGLMLAALVGTALVWRALVLTAFPNRQGLADVVPIVALAALPATFVIGGFIYDFPELLLTSACYLAFVRGRWKAWYVLLPLTVLNKEASVLVVVWWLSMRGEMPTRTWWLHVAASSALGGAIVVALWLSFRHHPGFTMQPNRAHNLHYWRSLKWLSATRDVVGIGVRLPIAFHVFNLAVIGGVVASSRVPKAVKRAFGWSVLAVAPLFLSFGFENEIRVFAVAIPPLVLIFAAAIQRGSTFLVAPSGAPGS